MRVLIADKFDQSGQDALAAMGCDVSLQPDLTPDELPEAVSKLDPEILIVRSTRVQRPVFDAADSLGLIVRAGAGYDTIDVEAASSSGIFVANCPGRNAVAVAELAWALILSCDRRIPDQTRDLRAGAWNKKEYGKARGLKGSTLGIIGLGRIGREVADRGRAFGMTIIAWSRNLTPERAEELQISHRGSAIDVARDADVISINVAATPDTWHLVGPDFCAAMKPGATIVNTSRGSVIDEDALIAAIRDKGVRAGLDVYDKEPGSGTGDFEGAIVNEPGVYGSHHIGASTDQAQRAIANQAARIVDTYLRTGEVVSCVNRAASTPATNLLTIRMKNQPGVLAHVFYILGQAKVNVEEMENVIYDGAESACARIQLDDAIGNELLLAIRANQHVLSADCASI